MLLLRLLLLLLWQPSPETKSTHGSTARGARGLDTGNATAVEVDGSDAAKAEPSTGGANGLLLLLLLLLMLLRQPELRGAGVRKQDCIATGRARRLFRHVLARCMRHRAQAADEKRENVHLVGSDPSPPPWNEKEG